MFLSRLAGALGKQAQRKQIGEIVLRVMRKLNRLNPELLAKQA